MNRIYLLILLTGILCINAIGQQNIYEPAKGSNERKDIMNAIREYDVSRSNLNKGETFVVNGLRVQKGWAYASVEQQTVSGETPYGQAHVFLKKEKSGWKVVFSTYNDSGEVGIDGLTKLKKNKTFPKQLAEFASSYLAG